MHAPVDPRAHEVGPTFALKDVGFIDFESRASVDIKTAGAVRYACDADAIVLVAAIGAGPIHVRAVYDFVNGPLRWVDMPAAVLNHHERVIRGEAVWAAWNAGFDRAIWNYATLKFPELQPHHIIDVMAQATVSGLPPDLAAAARASTDTRKVAAGKELIRLFCLPTSTATPQSHPQEWRQFCGEYATGDVEAMREVFRHTRQLPIAEWREYWAMEAINDRGVHVDLKLARHAARLAAEDRGHAAKELAQLTAGKITTADQVARIIDWLMLKLPPEGRDILTKREEEFDDDGELVKPAKRTLRRGQVERLITLLDNKYPELVSVLRVLQIRLYGGSKTPAKFARMLSSEVNGVLYGQYVFNGAPQTGRASSKGVQVHNLARDTLPYEPDLIDAVIAGADYSEVASLGDDTPVARKLALIIRPTFIPKGDNVFVWSDWSQIEARVLPWLCDHIIGAARRVEIFRAVDADPSLPDIYTRTAAILSRLDVKDVTKTIRQRGKVAELALGFCGGVGALQAMAAGYGLHLDDDEAKHIVENWRHANPWVMQYSQEIWNAMKVCIDKPKAEITVGRIEMTFLDGYLGGSLLCRLPSGRRLTYRALRWENIDVLDDDDKPTGEKKLEMMYGRGYGRAKLWPGVFMENFTQATAADFLRGTLARLEQDGVNVRLHTHDEILLECKAINAPEMAEYLAEIMQRGFDWSKGLPLMSEETVGYAYSKHEGSHGL